MRRHVKSSASTPDEPRVIRRWHEGRPNQARIRSRHRVENVPHVPQKIRCRTWPRSAAGGSIVSSMRKNPMRSPSIRNVARPRCQRWALLMSTGDSPFFELFLDATRIVWDRKGEALLGIQLSVCPNYFLKDTIVWDKKFRRKFLYYNFKTTLIDK